MIKFTFLAFLLAVAGVAWLCWPLVRTKSSEARSVLPVVGAAVLVPMLAFGTYLGATNWDWNAAAAAGPSVQEQLAALEDAADAAPGNVDALLQLGAGYASFGRWNEATEAYRKAYDQTGRQNPLVGLELAMAMTNANPATLDGEAAPLIEAGLAAQPDLPKALWLGGLLAARRGDVAAARERWQHLLALNPPPEVAQLLEQSIAQLGGVAADAVAGGAQPQAATEEGARTLVELTVTVVAGLKAQVPPGAALFLAAKDPTQPGPPFAAQRHMANELPLEAQLSDADAMMSGRTMSSAQQLTIIARVSLSGQPVAASGDLFGEASWQPGKSGKLSIVIDRKVP
jgi:cytochrome c-type biogenesis protein CcmH